MLGVQGNLALQKKIMKKLNALLFHQGGKCFYCDEQLDIKEASIDHIIPRAKGGKDDVDNLVVCCKYANHAFADCSPKQKMLVIKDIIHSPLLCQKLFPRSEEVKEVKEVIESQANNKPDENYISIAYGFLLQAIDSFEKEGKAASSSIVKIEMLKLEPSFKEATYGFKQFSKFLLSAEQDKIITLELQRKNNYLIKKYIK
jgi:hypothetical protein